MAIRFLLALLSLLFICVAIGFLIYRLEQFENLSEVAFDTMQNDLFLLGGLYVLAWYSAIQFKSFVQSRKHLGDILIRIVLHNTNKILVILRIFAGTIFQLAIGMALLSLAFGLMLTSSDQNQLSKTPPKIDLQLLQDYSLRISKAKERSLVRRIFKMRSRPEDQALVRLARGYRPQSGNSRLLYRGVEASL